MGGSGEVRARLREDAQHAWCWAALHPVCCTVMSASRRLPRGGCALAQVEVTTPSRPSRPILVLVLHLLCSVCPSLHSCLALVCLLGLLSLGLLLTPCFCFRVVVTNLFCFFFNLLKTKPCLKKNAHLIGVYGQSSGLLGFQLPIQESGVRSPAQDNSP